MPAKAGGREYIMKIALQVKNLVKSYNGKEVLHGISFDVEEGEIFALLGSNGAGKSTTLECIEGLKRYDSGFILFNNNVIEKQDIHEFIGIQLQSTALPNNITVVEAYQLFCKANHVNTDRSILERFGLRDILNKQYDTLSTGQKRRLHLALSLVHNPAIVFLDEPTAGLDVEGQVTLHEEIRRLKNQGKTVVMTSHNMAEVEKLCDRIAIIREGRVGFIGKPEELITSCEDITEIALKTEMGYQKAEFKYCQFVRSENEYDFYSTVEISEGLLELLQDNKVRKNKVLDIKVNHSNLEEKFMEFSREELA